MKNRLIAGVLGAFMLTGCDVTIPMASLQPTTIEQEGEIRSPIAAAGKAPAGQTAAQPQPRPTQQKPGGPFGSTGATGASGSATGTPQAGGDGATAGSAASDVAAPASPYLEVQSQPSGSFKIVAIRDGENALQDLMFFPEEPLAEWQVAYRSQTATTIKSVKITYEGMNDPWTVELTPKELEWPDTIGAGGRPIKLYLDINATFEYFDKHADASQRIDVSIQLLDAKGEPFLDQDQEPVTLRLPVTVL